MQPPWVMIAGSALAEPNDQNSGTASHSRSSARQVLPLADVEAVGDHGPCASVTPLGAAVEPEV